MNKKPGFEEALEAWCKENGIVWTKMEKRFYHLFSKGEPGSTEFEIEKCFGEGSPFVGLSDSYLSTVRDLVNSKEEFVKYVSHDIFNEFEMSKDPLYLGVYEI